MATDPYAPLETIETQPFLSNPPPELSMRPEDITAGGGFSREELQQTARQMQYDQDSVTSYMEAQAINQKAMEDLRAIREQREAKLAAERAGIDQLIDRTAARVRQRNEEARAREAELNPPGAALFRMQQQTAREEEARMRSRNRGSEMTYDPETRTWTQGTPPDRSDAAIERAIQLRKDLGYDASGVPVRKLEPSWKEGERRVRAMVEGMTEAGADINRDETVKSLAAAEQQRKTSYIDEVAAGTAGVPLTSADRDFIRSTPGGSAMLREYDNRLERVMRAITTQVGGLVGENGQIDQKKLIAAAIDNDSFTPSMAGDITNLTKNMADSYNIDAMKRRDLELKLKEQEQQSAGIGGRGRGGGGIKSASDIMQEAFVAGTLKKTIPEVEQLMTGGMSAGEALEYGKYNIETPAMTSTRRSDLANQLTYERFGVGALDGTAEGVVIDDAIIAEQSARIGDLYDAALKSQKDPVTYIAEQMSQATKGMTAVEGNQYIQEFVRLSDEYVKNQISTKAQGIIGAQVQEAGRRITNIGQNIVLDAQRAGTNAFAFDSKTWKEAVDTGRKEPQIQALEGMFADKLRSEYTAQLASVPPDGAAILKSQYDKYINALGTQFESEMAAQDPAFADLIEERDAFVRLGENFVKVKETEVDLSVKKASIERQGRASVSGRDNYETVVVGSVAYNIPISGVNERGERLIDSGLQRTLISYGDNWYVQEVVKNNSQGTFISDAGVATLSRINEPPQESIKQLYGPNIQGTLAGYIATLIPENKLRSVLQIQDLSAIPGMPAPAYTENEYASKIVPLIDVAQSIPTGKKVDEEGVVRNVGIEQSLRDTLVQIDEVNKGTFGGSLPDGVSPISKIINNDAMLRDIYYNGDTQESRKRAVAAAYTIQRASVQRAALNDVVGTVNPIDRKSSTVNISTVMDEVMASGPVDGTYRNRGDVVGEILSEFKDAERSIIARGRGSVSEVSPSAAQQLSVESAAMADINESIQELAERYQISRLEGLVDAYDKKMDTLGKAFDEKYSDLSNVDYSDILLNTSWTGMEPKDAVVFMKQQVDGARSIVDAYNSLVDIRDGIRVERRGEKGGFAAPPIGYGR